MAIISDVKLAQYAAQAGFRGPQLVTSIAVAIAENRSKNTTAVNHNTNGSTDTGLWQINSVHKIGNLTDPLVNAKAAFKISGGGTNWTPWVTYKRGLHKPFIARAKKAISGMSGGTITPDQIVDAGTGGPDLGVGTAIGNLSSTIRKFTDALTRGDIWIRVFLTVAGIAAFLIGLGLIAADIGLSSKTFTKISKVIPG